MIEKNEEIIKKLENLGTILYQLFLDKDITKMKISEFNVKYGTSIPQSKRSHGNIPLYSSSGIADYINKANCKTSIIFGCRGTVGKVFYNKNSCFVLNTAFYIEESKNYGSLYFALKYHKGLSLYATGAAQPQITIENIENVSILIPNNNIFNHILDNIDEYKNKNEKLKYIKQLLLNKYFD